MPSISIEAPLCSRFEKKGESIIFYETRKKSEQAGLFLTSTKSLSCAVSTEKLFLKRTKKKNATCPRAGGEDARPIIRCREKKDLA